MARQKPTREERIGKLLETVERAIPDIFPEKPKTENGIGKAHAALMRAAEAIRDAQLHVANHNVLLRAQLDTLKAELSA
jgi:Rad3-related DNA helicase